MTKKEINLPGLKPRASSFLLRCFACNPEINRRVIQQKMKKKIKRLFKKENIYRTVIVISGLALIATSVLPYIL